MSYKILQIILSFLFLVFEFSCSSHDQHSAPQKNGSKSIQESDSVYQYSLKDYSDHNITFQKVATIRDSLGTGVMGHVAVDDKNRIYIADGGFPQKIQTIHIYSPTGNYIGDMGRAGSGPGEFNRLAQIAIQDGKLFAYDKALRRINVFSLKSRSSIATIILNPKSWNDISALEKSSPDKFYVVNDDKILLGFTDPLQPESSKKRYAKYYWIDHKGNIVSGQVFKIRNVNFYSGTGIPQAQLASNPTLTYDRNALLAVSNKGRIYSAWTESFKIKVYSSKGKHLYTYKYPFKKAPLSENNLYSRYKDNRDFRQKVSDDVPKTWPALNYMFLDDQERLWISTITQSGGQYRWWVLGRHGKPIGTFEWPGRRLYRDRENRRLRAIKNRYLYALKTDSTTGLQQIDKYRIKMH